ncbi:family carbohydrate kinase [Colletotrichum incanum]|uniref:Family carbohydrate kinase n=1 Tax=Colletotrichum incanum TaxID=1573173 RepID=A0A167DND8_COLIC|nr:family carbohydrate kinase [Colletotrichum incanum]
MTVEPGTAPEPDPTPAPASLSLGTVVLDDICCPDGRVHRDVPSGSGFCCTLGPYFAVLQSESVTVCCLVTAGSDSPASVK